MPSSFFMKSILHINGKCSWSSAGQFLHIPYIKSLLKIAGKCSWASWANSFGFPYWMFMKNKRKNWWGYLGQLLYNSLSNPYSESMDNARAASWAKFSFKSWFKVDEKCSRSSLDQGRWIMLLELRGVIFPQTSLLKHDQKSVENAVGVPWQISCIPFLNMN